MVHTLFEDFLENQDRFQACRDYWEQLIEDVVRSHGQAGDWKPWISRYYADGESLIDLDLQPIFDGRSAKLDRAFRIHQHPSEDDREVVIWARVSDYDSEEYADTIFPRDELFISLVLSEESAELTKELLRRWMAPETTVDGMRAFIREYLGQEHAE